MGSQMLDIIRQGIWASLTGGWYYNPHHDPHHRLFTNTLHLYAWLFLLCLPFSIHLYFPIGSWAVWLVYSIIIGIFFVIIKSLNTALHHLFETGHLHEETVGKVNITSSKFGSSANKTQEEIELQDIRTDVLSSTPPVGCSSRNSVSEARDNEHATSRRGRIRERAASTFDLKVDVHTSKPAEDAGRTSELDGASQQPSGDAGSSLYNQLHSVGPHPTWVHSNGSQQRSSAGATGPQRSPPPHFKPWHGAAPNHYNGAVAPQTSGAAGVKFLLSGHPETPGEAEERQENSDVVILVEESPGHKCGGDSLVGNGQSKHRSKSHRESLKDDKGLGSKKREDEGKKPLDGEVEALRKMRKNLGLEALNDRSQLEEPTPCDRLEDEQSPNYQLAGDEPSPSHRSQDQTPGHRSQGEVSISSDSHSISMSGEQDKSLRMDGARRFSNLSNLARSLPSGSSSALQPVTGTGSLDLAAILDTSLSGVRRRGQGGRQERHVRRTRSALETSGVNRLVGGVASHPVSLDAGINSEVRGRTRTGPRGRSLDLTNSEVIAEIAEGSDEVGGSWEENEEPFSRTVRQLNRQDSVDGCGVNSDVDMVTYQSQLAEATNALLVAGKYLAEEDSKSEVKSGSGTYSPIAGSTSDWSKTEDKNGSGVFLPMVGASSDWNDEASPSRNADSRVERPESPTSETTSKSKDNTAENEDREKADCELSSEASGLSAQAQRPKLERETHSLLSTVGLDWLFGDSEPDQPPGSPKLVPGGDSNYVRNRGSRSQSPKLATQDSSESREPRDSSHGSSGTDTETRTLLKALSTSDYSNVKISKMTGGAIPKRRPSYPRPGLLSELPKPPETRVECGPSWDNESSWENEWRRKNAIRRRPTVDSSNDVPSDDLDASPSLHDDAAGLMLFLDILNMPDGERNLEAENELKRLVECRRKRMDEDCQRVKKKRDSDRKATTRRRRRHNAEHQSSNEGEHQDFPFPTPQMVLDERKQEDEGAKRKRRKSRKRGRSKEEPSRDDVARCAHVAASHEDTSSGAVHCFQDEKGNWQTYQFGGDSQVSTTVGLPSTVTPGRALAGFLNRQMSTDAGGSTRPGRPPPPDPPNSAHCERWSRSQSSSSLSADSGLTVILDSPATVFQPTTQSDRRSGDSQPSQRELRLHPFGGGSSAGTQPPLQLRRYHNPLHMFAESFFERTRAAASAASIGNNAELTFSTSSGGCVQLAELENSSLAGQLNLDTGAPRIRKYHLLPIPGTKGLKITMDRLQLEALLDQDKTVIHSVLCVFLAVLSSVLGSLVMETGLYKDVWVLLFCLVQASCQYTLMKSVQPDASSPTHGFNRITVFSRPIYFSICCTLLLFLEYRLHTDVTGFHLYGRIWFDVAQLTHVRNFFYTLILLFPILFSLGLFPQANTALIYTFEQIDIQLFGGNAASSLQSSVFCVLRSVFSVAGLFGFAYGGLTVGTHSAHAQEVLFSIFCALTVAVAYHLSRGSGDPTVAMSILKRHLLQLVTEESPAASAASLTPPALPSPSPSSPTDELGPPTDPLPKKLRDTVNARLKNDAIVMILTSVIVFLVHQSDAFMKGHPKLDIVLWSIAGITGFLLHYLLPHLRKQTPWQCFSAPILTSHEHSQFEVRAAAKVMWWEKILLWISMLERSVLYPLIFLSAVTLDRPVFKELFGLWGGSIVMTVTMLKCLRIAFSDCAKQYLVLTLSLLLFQYQPDGAYLNNIKDALPRRSPFLLDYFLTSILMLKLEELYLKCQFVITYIAPHQINWGSAFHAFAQPFSVPHSAMLFLQAVLSSILSTPLNPILGSTIFITSYVRPIKFWERNYNTKRTDHSNTRLSAQFENRNPGADDNNLNSIFYEHLTRSLQHSLCGDLMLGRWGPVQQGDCFVLASDYLNCLVHIIELGNGLCTFQVRGLEFRGTYCQQREVEAISEGVEEDEGCCCCEPGHLPHMLSVNAAFSQRWLAWEVAATKYVLEGYSISDNSAQSMLQVFDLRKVLINYYVKSIIYYTVRSPKLGEWMANPTIQEAIKVTMDKGFVDLDPMFNANIDEDFDYRSSGITRPSFCNVYLNWIQHCVNHRDKDIPATKDSEVVSLCLALSLLGRRALGAASNNSLTSVEFFLIGLHALFKGDFRITSVRDEWVFSDMELLRKVVAPGVRMCLKLHQDHFMSPDEYEEPSVLYDAICGHERDLIISHEGDPAWRAAVLSGAPSLLALRHVVDDGTDEYKIIMLNKRHLSFRVIKLNRECVRGLWAGQQQELIFLRNRNPERGSIQNAKQALRNIINSSCDQPIGYPIYVSPLTTSYSETSEPVSGVVGGPVSFSAVKQLLITCCDRIRQRCVEGCSSGSSAPVEADTQQQCDPEVRGGSLTGNRASTVSTASKPSSGTLVSLAGLLGSQSLVDKTGGASSVQMARIVDPLLVYDNMNLGRRIDPLWPMADWQAKGGRSAWKDWIPLEGMEGQVVHRWTPSNPLPLHRSHIDRTILLLKLDDKYVPIAESAVQFLPVREASVDSDWKRSPDVTELRASRLAQAGPVNSRIGPIILPRVVDNSPPDKSPSMDRRADSGEKVYDRDKDVEMAAGDDRMDGKETGLQEQNLCMEILRHMENENVVKDSEKDKCANEDTTSRDVYIDIGDENKETSDNHIQNNT